MKKLVLLTLLAMSVSPVYAQNIFNLNHHDNLVYSRIGIEPTYVLAVGYMKSFDLPSVNRNLVAYGEVSSPLQLIRSTNYEAKMGVIANLLKYKRFGVTYGLNVSTGHVETKNFSSQKMAFANKLLAGYFSDSWYLAFSGEHEHLFANRITHTEYYRDYIFPEAKDGWYKGAGGNIQLGLEAGFRLVERVDIRFELKVPRSEYFNSYYGSPANLTLAVGYIF